MGEHIINGPKPVVDLSQYESVGIQLYDSLKLHGNLPIALTDAATGEHVSYTNILERSCLLAESLRNHGITENDVIGIFSENNLDYFYPVIAALYLGTPLTTFNHHYVSGELLHAANISKPTIIFCSKITFDKLLEVKEQMPYLKDIILLYTDEGSEGYEPIKSFIKNNSSKTFSVKDFKPLPVDTNERVAFILYSSGTTGLPKGVLLTHNNINATIALSRDARYFKQFQPGTETALGLLPFYHTFGLVVFLRCLIFGRKIVVLSSFVPNLFLTTISDYKITTLHLVPPLAIFLAKDPLLDRYNLSSLKVINCGAAPLSKDIEELLMKRLTAKIFRQAYGMTETTLAVLGFPYGETKSGSCGKVLPYVSAKIVDPETGHTLKANCHGEFYFKGAFIMKGYAGNEEATKEIIDENGWLATGDVGFYDEEGYFYVVDRLKELIKYKGFQVPPAELEAILLSHPKIIDVGVVGLKDEVAGELPIAFVVPKTGIFVDEQEIHEFVNARVSVHKRLRGGVRFIEAIPRNQSGKILRKELRELLKQKPKL